jgi:hypothetical protein
MWNLILSVVVSVAASSAVTAGLVFVLKTYIGEKIKKSIEHEYATKMERLRADNAQQQSVQAVATALLAGSRQASHDRRLTAIETLWSAILRLKEMIPAVVGHADILLETEYGELLTNERFAADFTELPDEQQVHRQLESVKEVESVRLYLGERLFLYFFVYRAITFRIAYLFDRGRKAGRVLPWYRDSGIRQLLGHVLSQEEMVVFDQQKFCQLNWVQALIETKILQHADRVISGQESAEFGHDQALKIARLLADTRTSIDAD